MPRILMFSLTAIALVGLLLAGCGGTDSKGTGKKEGGKVDEHAGHDHAAHGPHEGHLIELAEPGKENKEEYHVEWDHTEDGKVTVWVLDGTAKKEVPIAADHVVIEVKAGDKADPYELPAMDRGEKATAFKFEVVSKELLGKLETVGKTVSAKVVVDVNGKTYEGNFEQHEEHEGHKH